MTAIGLSDLMFAQPIWMIDVNGTAKNMPATPHKYPHTVNETRMMNGLRFSWMPWMRGSRMLPNTIWMEVIRKATYRMFGQLGKNCSNAMMIVITVITMDPMLGMKFSTKASTPHKMAKSRPVASDAK